MGDGNVRAAALATELTALRESAGAPSFRRMAERSGRISHTTLHEAVKGTRFPSWETVREFAKACDADEAHWRERWEEYKGVPPLAPVGEAPVGRPKRRYALILAAIVVVVLGVVGVIVLSRYRTVDVGALIPGDDSLFVADVTLPDGATLHPGEQALKVWEIQNTGSVPWHERYLQRMDLPAAPGTCGTPDRVLIGDTAPGEHVMISVPLTASARPGRCWIGWKMVDAAGREFFTTRRPVYLLVNVVTQ